MQLISFADDPLGNLAMFIIPSLILGTALSAATMRMTRTIMLEVLRQDYIRTAWSKGLRERVVVIRHAIKNALIPVVTLKGLMDATYQDVIGRICASLQTTDRYVGPDRQVSPRERLISRVR